jgi:hypothetical protein
LPKRVTSTSSHSAAAAIAVSFGDLFLFSGPFGYLTVSRDLRWAAFMRRIVPMGKEMATASGWVARARCCRLLR